MNRFAYRGYVGLVLALAIFVLSMPSIGRADDDEDAKKAIAAAAAAIKDYVKSTAGKENKKAAEAIAKAHKIEFVMHQFKPRKKGGLGVGEPEEKITPDSIELKIGNMADPKKALKAPAIAKEKAALLKMSETMIGMGDIVHFYKPTTPKAGVKLDNWTKYTNEMQAGSKELMKALKDGDPKAVEKASIRVNASCTDCHGDFR